MISDAEIVVFSFYDALVDAIVNSKRFYVELSRCCLKLNDQQNVFDHLHKMTLDNARTFLSERRTNLAIKQTIGKKTFVLPFGDDGPFIDCFESNMNTQQSIYCLVSNYSTISKVSVNYDYCLFQGFYLAEYFNTKLEKKNSQILQNLSDFLQCKIL
jgi:hypothetical protein